jgi:hypothetical protein
MGGHRAKGYPYSPASSAIAGNIEYRAVTNLRALQQRLSPRLGCGLVFHPHNHAVDLRTEPDQVRKRFTLRGDDRERASSGCAWDAAAGRSDWRAHRSSNIQTKIGSTSPMSL